MTVAKSKRPVERKPSTLKTSPSNRQSIAATINPIVSTSKLIQNLGSSNNGVQFKIEGNLKTAYGRD